LEFYKYDAEFISCVIIWQIFKNKEFKTVLLNSPYIEVSFKAENYGEIMKFICMETH